MEFRGVRLRADLLAAGLSVDELRRMEARGEIRRLRYGAYVAADDPALADRVASHVLRIRAAVSRSGPGAVVSHASAAVLYGLPCWGIDLGRVHLTRDRVSGARRTRDVHVHAARLPSSDVAERRSLLVTGPARTVVDIARSCPFEQAVVVADAALARPDRETLPLTTPAELADAVGRAAGRPGATAARRVVAFADGRSGGVGESRSRTAMAAAGLPAPELQWVVRGPSGMHIGTVDFAWPDRCTVGEFDGRVKYGRLLRPGEEPGDAVYREKRREDAIRDEGWTVVRWAWPDLRAFAQVEARLRKPWTADNRRPRPHGRGVAHDRVPSHRKTGLRGHPPMCEVCAIRCGRVLGCIFRAPHGWQRGHRRDRM